MADDFTAVLPPLIGFAVYVPGQIIAYRLRLRPDRLSRLLHSVVLAMLAGGVAAGWAHAHWVWTGVSAIQDWGLLAVNAIAYVGLAYTYLHFLTMGETARRIRILVELTRAGDQGMETAAILSKYGVREIIDRRVERLFDKRQIEERDGRLFVLKGQVLWIANAIWLLRRILGMADERPPTDDRG